ncbi:MAG: hypothetical protein ACUVXE_06565 [Anaerolineae bacterium]
MSRPAVASARDAERWIFVVALLLAALVTARTPADPDMWWHLSAGREMLARGEILTRDVFSYTRTGAPWTNAFWLADIGMYLLYRLGGFPALSLAMALLAALTMAIVYRQMTGLPILRAAVLILATVAAAPAWSPRPQLLSYLLLALLDLWLTQWREGAPRQFWRLPPLFALWANLHGGFIWGFLLLIAWIVGEALDRLFGEKGGFTWKELCDLSLFTALSIPAVLLNPNGLAIWRLPFYTVSVSLRISEWLSPDFHQFSFHPMLWLLFLLMVGLARLRERIPLAALLKVIGFADMTFVSVRAIGVYAIVTAPVVARTLAGVIGPLPVDRWRARSIPRPAVRRLVNASFILVLAAAVVARAVALSSPALVEKSYPTGAVTWLKTHRPEGRLFNSYNWGGYLLWALPEYPVFVDGRADLYGDEVLSQWWQVVNGEPEGWDVLERWDVRLILLEPDWPVVQELPARGWRELYRDETAVVFGKR